MSPSFLGEALAPPPKRVEPVPANWKLESPVLPKLKLELDPSEDAAASEPKLDRPLLAERSLPSSVEAGLVLPKENPVPEVFPEELPPKIEGEAVVELPPKMLVLELVLGVPKIEVAEAGLSVVVEVAAPKRGLAAALAMLPKIEAALAD